MSLQKSMIAMDDFIHTWFQKPLTIIVITIKSIFKPHSLSWKLIDIYNSLDTAIWISHRSLKLNMFHIEPFPTCSYLFNVTEIDLMLTILSTRKWTKNMYIINFSTILNNTMYVFFKKREKIIKPTRGKTLNSCWLLTDFLSATKISEKHIILSSNLWRKYSINLEFYTKTMI